MCVKNNTTTLTIKNIYFCNGLFFYFYFNRLIPINYSTYFPAFFYYTFLLLPQPLNQLLWGLYISLIVKPFYHIFTTFATSFLAIICTQLLSNCIWCDHYINALWTLQHFFGRPWVIRTPILEFKAQCPTIERTAYINYPSFL